MQCIVQADTLPCRVGIEKVSSSPSSILTFAPSKETEDKAEAPTLNWSERTGEGLTGVLGSVHSGLGGSCGVVAVVGGLARRGDWGGTTVTQHTDIHHPVLDSMNRLESFTQLNIHHTMHHSLTDLIQ